jgi:hypothetical protein
LLTGHNFSKIYVEAKRSLDRETAQLSQRNVAICVTDAQEGLAFYRDVLGTTQLPRSNLGPGSGSTPAASRCT